MSITDIIASRDSIENAAEPFLLVVDDDNEIREELSAYLGANGFRVVSAGNGADAVARLAENKFDMMLLDLWLDGENGFDVLRKVRKTSQIPCIMVTAQDEVTDKIVGLELGADDYLVKPVNLRELLARVRALIRRAEPYKGTERRNPNSQAMRSETPRPFGRRSSD